MIEDLVGRRLVAVERLSWESSTKAGRPEVGPVRLVFDNGHGLVLSGSTSWALDLQVTAPGDDSWLSTYRYDIDGDRWLLRDAANEETFVDAVHATLTDWQPVFNEAQEVVGMRLWFDGHEVPLILREGEIST